MDGDVVTLCQRPDLIPGAAALMVQTWPDHYGLGGPGCATTDLQNRCQTHGLPFGFVAHHDGQTVGLGALDAASCGSQPNEKAWLVGLCVTPTHRHQGIGSQIVHAAMVQAAVQGHDAIFATTQNAAGLLARLGWQDLRGFEDGSGAWRVFRQTL